MGEHRLGERLDVVGLDVVAAVARASRGPWPRAAASGRRAAGAELDALVLARAPQHPHEVVAQRLGGVDAGGGRRRGRARRAGRRRPAGAVGTRSPADWWPSIVPASASTSG